MLLGHSFPILARALLQPSWSTWVQQYPQETEPTPFLSITVSLTLTSSNPRPHFGKIQVAPALGSTQTLPSCDSQRKARRPRGSDYCSYYCPRSKCWGGWRPCTLVVPILLASSISSPEQFHLLYRGIWCQTTQPGMGISKGQGKGHWVLPFALWHLFPHPLLAWPSVTHSNAVSQHQGKRCMVLPW